MPQRIPEAPQRNLALELVRVTEAAALAAGRWQGRGDKIGADRAGVDAMRIVLGTVSMDGVVVIGEGEKDEAPMLFNGERVGTGDAPMTDIAVDPVEGTTLVAQGQAGAVAVIAIAERGTMFDPGPCFYMEKLVVGAESARVVSLDQTPAENVRAVAKAKGEDVRDVTVTILDRPRNHDLIAAVRESGARIRLIEHGDVAGALSAVWPNGGSDMLYGIGGTPEGVIAAAALRCMGGAIQGRLWPQSPDERVAAVGSGYDVDRILHTEDLVRGDNCFFAATGITDGSLLRGVSYAGDSATTQSLVMRSKSGTVRMVDARHRLDKLATFSTVDYE